MKYIVQNTTLLHNGKKYPEESVIDLTEEEAQNLTNFLIPLKDSKHQGDKKDKNTKNNKDRNQENTEDEKDKQDNLNTSTNPESTQNDGGKP